jgi:hypothetical protein
VVLAASIKEAAAKLAQAAASYQDGPKDDQFQQPSSCQLVEGTISSSGWCKFWIKKAS